MSKLSKLSKAKLGKIFLCVLLLWGCSTSKTFDYTSKPISDCEAAVHILSTGKHQFNFIGNGGKENDFAAYPKLSGIRDENTVWFTFIAPFDGNFKIKMKNEKDPLQMVIFQTFPKNNICEDIRSGKAQVKRFFSAKKVNYIQLSDSIAPNVQFPLALKASERIQLAVVTSPGKKSLTLMEIALIPQQSEELNGTGQGTPVIVDKRNSVRQRCTEIKIRDIESNLPVVAAIKINGLMEANGNYKASDLFLVHEQSANMELRCFARGYYFVDRIETVYSEKSNLINVWMEPSTKEKPRVFQDIQFMPGSNEFYYSSYRKLRRLVDNMVLNPRIKIEIQGHAWDKKTGTSAAKLLSEARAKRVAQFLIDAGIEKSRISTVGFGGTKPIFPEPKTDEQVQANRRVEFLVY